jgi:hypothetical protein
MGMTVFHDAPRQRMLPGGGTTDRFQTKAGGFNRPYAFDPKTEKVSRLADCPTALCRAGLAHDSKRDRFLVAVRLEGKGIEQPSGVFAYDPKKDEWSEVHSCNALPLKRNGWMPLCYDPTHDCLIGMVGTTCYAFRWGPQKK